MLFVDSADKAARFIWLCDAFGIPLLFLADVPGFMIGKAVERQGIIRHGAKMISAVADATVPKICVVLRKAYGAGLYAMCGPGFDPDATIALPQAMIAVMGAEAAVNAVYANKIAEKPEAERPAYVEELRASTAPDIDLREAGLQPARRRGGPGRRASRRAPSPPGRRRAQDGYRLRPPQARAPRLTGAFIDSVQAASAPGCSFVGSRFLMYPGNADFLKILAFADWRLPRMIRSPLALASLSLAAVAALLGLDSRDVAAQAVAAAAPVAVAAPAATRTLRGTGCGCAFGGTRGAAEGARPPAPREDRHLAAAGDRLLGAGRHHTAEGVRGPGLHAPHDQGAAGTGEAYHGALGLQAGRADARHAQEPDPSLHPRAGAPDGAAGSAGQRRRRRREAFIDGTNRGTVPNTFEVPAGRHQVEVRKQGMKPFSDWFDLAEGERRTRDIILEKAELPTGTLLVTSDAGGDVYVDGQRRDAAPAIITGIAAGEHVIEVRKEGLAPWRQTVTVPAGQQAKVAADLRLRGRTG